MKGAGLLFLGVCVSFAILLLTKAITIITSEAIFAITLVTLVIVLRYFKTKNGSNL